MVPLSETSEEARRALLERDEHAGERVNAGEFDSTLGGDREKRDDTFRAWLPSFISLEKFSRIVCSWFILGPTGSLVLLRDHTSAK